MTFADHAVRRWLRAVLAVVAFAAFAGPALAAPVGKVLAASGNTRALGADGRERPLVRDAAVEQGDTLITGADGSLQVRFVDDALLILRPDARMRIDDYHAQGGVFHSLMNLVSGGMRMLTGRIAKLNRERFSLVTTTAVIGVRGTDFELRLCKADCGPDVRDGLYLGVTRGAIVARNDAGEFELREHEYGRIDDKKAALKKLDCPPTALTGVGCQGGKTPPEAGLPPGFRAGDELTSDRLLQSYWCAGNGVSQLPDPRFRATAPLVPCP